MKLKLHLSLLIILFVIILTSCGGDSGGDNNPEDYDPITVPSISYQMVYISPGTFMMGSPSSEAERDSDETQHEVTLTKGFYLGVTEVTQGQWKTIMENNPSYFDTCGDDCPVENVSWDECQEFIEKLNQQEGSDKYRLPTEAEWEYACRAGTETPFYFGTCLSTDQANFDGNYPYTRCAQGVDRRMTTSVKSFIPNAWGLYDMHCNVYEWCQDWYDSRYPTGSVSDPTGQASGSGRVIRGGSWLNHSSSCRSADRYSAWPDGTGNNLGFRLAGSDGDIGETTPLADIGQNYYLNTDDRLTRSPASGAAFYSAIFRGGFSDEYSIDLTGYITAGIYSYDIWAWAVGSSFRIDIILVQSGAETCLATWADITTTDSNHYVQIQGTTNGPELITKSGDRLLTRITHTGPYMAFVRIGYSAECQSHITVGHRFSGGESDDNFISNAGPDQNVKTGSLVTLDGSGSSDADGELLSYNWTFISVPNGSNVTLSDSTAVNPTFIADIDGTYVVNLVVDDGIVDSQADTVSITATTTNSTPNIVVSSISYEMIYISTGTFMMLL